MLEGLIDNQVIGSIGAKEYFITPLIFLGLGIGAYFLDRKYNLVQKFRNFYDELKGIEEEFEKLKTRD